MPEVILNVHSFFIANFVVEVSNQAFNPSLLKTAVKYCKMYSYVASSPQGACYSSVVNVA